MKQDILDLIDGRFEPAVLIRDAVLAEMLHLLLAFPRSHSVYEVLSREDVLAAQISSDGFLKTDLDVDRYERLPDGAVAVAHERPDALRVEAYDDVLALGKAAIYLVPRRSVHMAVVDSGFQEIS